jgi:hypothetical protein
MKLNRKLVVEISTTLFLITLILSLTSCYSPSGGSDAPLLVHLDGISEATLDAIKGETGPQGPQGDPGPGTFITTTQVNNTTTTQVNNTTTTQVNNTTTTIGFLYGPYSNIPNITSVVDGMIYVDTDDSHYWQAQLVSGYSLKDNYVDNMTTSNHSYDPSSDIGPSWVATSSYTITKISVHCIKEGTGTFTLKVYACDANHLSTGSVLCTASIAPDTSMGWYDAIFTSGTTLTQGNEYCFLVCGGTDNSNDVKLSRDSANEYTNGGLEWANGTTWYSNMDAGFKIYTTGTLVETWVQIK